MSWGDGTPQAPIASAAVIVLRDGAAGLELLLIQRHELSDVLGGAHTFPGGKVDRGDHDAAAALDVAPAALHAALAEPALTPAQAAALYTAAMRELHEEAGIAQLNASQLVPWARWVTPLASRRARKHFDARFFAALVPPGAQAVHDEREAIASAWTTPLQGLRDFEAGRLWLAPPQTMTLLELAAHRSAAEALAAARQRAPLYVQPVAAQDGGQELICFPGDVLHPVAQRALPGPTRLVWRDGRFQFEAPLDTLLLGG